MTAPEPDLSGAIEAERRRREEAELRASRLEQELASIHSSRLWRTASLYWSLRGLFSRRKRRVAETPDFQTSDPVPFAGMRRLGGRCNICGRTTSFYFDDPALFRETLYCGNCLATSRYRSIARGVLRAVGELAGVRAASLAELPALGSERRLRIYDTQPAFRADACSYPVPELLGRCSWIEVFTSTYEPGKPPGIELAPGLTNQNLEKLGYPDGLFDIVITSDVMEHVRLADRAHAEIRRVLRPEGIYLFTVPQLRERRQTIDRVRIVDPSDPGRDLYVMEKEFHGNANSEDGLALVYRSYGTELDEQLTRLGFSVEHTLQDFEEIGIRNTELFYCRLAK